MVSLVIEIPPQVHTMGVTFGEYVIENRRDNSNLFFYFCHLGYRLVNIIYNDIRSLGSQ